MPERTNLDNHYLESESWKCLKSPTGAHCWVFKVERNKQVGICKYCGKRAIIEWIKRGYEVKYVNGNQELQP